VCPLESLKKTSEGYQAFPFLGQGKGLKYIGKDREKKKEREKQKRGKGVLKLRRLPSPTGWALVAL
jgi:hypothetical protein